MVTLGTSTCQQQQTPVSGCATPRQSTHKLPTSSPCNSLLVAWLGHAVTPSPQSQAAAAAAAALQVPAAVAATRIGATQRWSQQQQHLQPQVRAAAAAARLFASAACGSSRHSSRRSSCRSSPGRLGLHPHRTGCCTRCCQRPGMLRGCAPALLLLPPRRQSGSGGVRLRLGGRRHLPILLLPSVLRTRPATRCS